jgi:hypothetical protein
MINKAVNEYWIDHIKKISTYFKSLDYLNASNYSNAALASVLKCCLVALQIIGSCHETQFDRKSCYISSWRLYTSQGWIVMS